MIDAPGWNSSQTIDWAKAPEWAGAVVEARRGTKFWVTKFGGVSARQRVGASEPDAEVAKMHGNHGWTLVETRPIEPPAWNGEGLPPVGTVCEFRWSVNNWKQCTVFAHQRNTNEGVDVLVELDDGWTFSGKPQLFRPIRTPDQVAIDELLQSIRDYGEDDRGLAVHLYAAGYRKVEQP